MNDHVSSDLAAHERSTEAAELRYGRVEEEVRAELRASPALFAEALGQWAPGADDMSIPVQLFTPHQDFTEYERKRLIHHREVAEHAMYELWLHNAKTPTEGAIACWLSDLIDRYAEDEVGRRVGREE